MEAYLVGLGYVVDVLSCISILSAALTIVTFGIFKVVFIVFWD